MSDKPTNPVLCPSCGSNHIALSWEIGERDGALWTGNGWRSTGTEGIDTPYEMSGTCQDCGASGWRLDGEQSEEELVELVTGDPLYLADALDAARANYERLAKLQAIAAAPLERGLEGDR